MCPVKIYPDSEDLDNPVTLAQGGLGTALTDPGADRILFWDESGNIIAWLTAGSGLSIAGTTITATATIAGSTGATDNAILRADGTGGSTLQASAAFVDDNGNVYAPNIAPGLISIATAAGTTTLTVASKGVQVFTGVTTQTVTLPVVTTLPQIGFGYLIINDSTGAVTVNSSGGNAVQIIAANSRALITCVLLTGTSAASWASTYTLGGIQTALDAKVTKAAGAGTTNAVTKFDASDEAADSQIIDDGTYININKAAQTDAKLFTKSSSDTKFAAIFEANSSSASNKVVDIHSDVYGLNFQNTAGNQQIGSAGRDGSGNLQIVADLFALLLQAGAAATDVELRTNNTGAKVKLRAENSDGLEVDKSVAAGQTRLLVYDVDNGTLERVTVGAADSGGAGFKVLRIAN